MRVLFIKHGIPFPHASGQDVHSFHMMRALGAAGCEVGAATVAEPSPVAIAKLRLAYLATLRGGCHPPRAQSTLTPLQDRFRSYYGIQHEWIARAGDAAETFRPDAVVGVGLDVLPYLTAVRGPIRIWYAADEWVWHHLSQLRLLDRSSWTNLRDAAIKGVYERAFASAIDRAWVVSPAERRAMRLVAGVGAVDTISNGVDGEHFRPSETEELPRSAIFWGRLDFGPNVQALEWFCRNVWPLVRSEVPDAQFTIVGYNPCEAVRRLAVDGSGVRVKPDMPDLRAEAARHAVVVLPFVSGGGIKNKLLEAASLGKAIVCSARACGGLRGSLAPLVRVRRQQDWARAIVDLWRDRERRQRLGGDARLWVTRHHTWDVAAREAVAGLQQSLAMRMVR